MQRRFNVGVLEATPEREAWHALGAPRGMIARPNNRLENDRDTRFSKNGTRLTRIQPPRSAVVHGGQAVEVPAGELKHLLGPMIARCTPVVLRLVYGQPAKSASPRTKVEDLLYMPSDSCCPPSGPALRPALGVHMFVL